MGLPSWLARRVAGGSAPSPYYAAIGALDAAGSLPPALAAALADPRASVSALPGPRDSLSALASAVRSPTRHYDSLVKRGHVRVVGDGTEMAVRSQVPLIDDQLAGPARATAQAIARGSHHLPGLPRRGVRHH